jgi:hypothetical protein
MHAMDYTEKPSTLQPFSATYRIGHGYGADPANAYQ